MRKTIFAILMSFLLVVSAIGALPPVKVSAATVSIAPVAYDADATAEIISVLISFLKSCGYVSGMEKATDSMSEDFDFLSAFDAFAKSAIAPDMSWWDGMQIELSDGRVITNGEIGEIMDFALKYDLIGNKTATLEPPEWWVDEWAEENDGTTTAEEDWTEYQKLFRAYLEEISEVRRYGVDPSEGPPDDPFNKVKVVVAGSALFAVAGSFLESLVSGLLEDATPQEYYWMDNIYYTGLIPQDADGYYHFWGFMGPLYQDGTGSVSIDTRFPTPNYACLRLSIGEDSGRLGIGFVALGSDGTSLRPITLSGSSSGMTGITPISGLWYKVNFPVFASDEEALLYLQTGYARSAVNYPGRDWFVLAGKVPSIMSPYVDKPISPLSSIQLENAVQNAAQTVPKVDVGTETQTSTEINTDVYKQTMTDTVKNKADATQTLPKPDVETKPDSGSDTDKDTGTDTDKKPNADDYKVDLTEVFPFCIPFDFIHLLQALSAEPQTPVFEFPFVIESLGINIPVDIDLSWMDDIMKVSRLGELGLWILLLMGSTSKLIRW